MKHWMTALRSHERGGETILRGTRFEATPAEVRDYEENKRELAVRTETLDGRVPKTAVAKSAAKSPAKKSAED